MSDFSKQVIRALTSQGSADFIQQHREPRPDNGGMTQEQWNRMSFTEKQQWQQQARGARR